jgi:hypothetical protein
MRASVTATNFHVVWSTFFRRSGGAFVNRQSFTAVGILPSPTKPRIDEWHAGRLEVFGIPRHHMQAIALGCGGN